ncbi:MAG: APC family permease, partial [Pirellulales bacterium]
VAINGAFVHVLGMEGVRHSRAVAADTVRVGLGQGADRAISLLICLSCLGAIHGMLLTGSRIYYAMGTRYPFFATLGTWNRRTGTPTTSLILQTGITVAVVLGFGLYENSFQRMVVFTAPIFWFFFLLTGLSLFVLRWKVRSEAAPQTTGAGPHNMPQSLDVSAVEKPNRSRGFRVIGYPLTPGLFCLVCLLMLVESLAYAFERRASEAVWSTLLLAIGCLLSVTAAGRAGGETARVQERARFP